jgi:hypothetical protein
MLHYAVASSLQVHGDSFRHGSERSLDSPENPRGRFCRYQRPALYSTTIPTSGTSVNQMTLLLARAPMTRAARRGPKDWPAFPM